MKRIIYFPSSYRKALLQRTKTYTIRTGRELDKYKESCIYDVFSYGQTDWKLRIKIDKINKVKVDELSKLGIPKRSVDSLINKTHLGLKDKVELIHFSYLD